MDTTRAIDINWNAELPGQLEWRREDASMAALVLHINHEVIHHGAGICLLRDLYRWREDRNGL